MALLNFNILALKHAIKSHLNVKEDAFISVKAYFKP